MNCKKCGFLMEDDARVCPFCHTAVQELGSGNVTNHSRSPSAKTNQSAQQAAVTYQHPMKWYKFLIYFSLIAGAIVNFISGLVFFSTSSDSGAPRIMILLGMIYIALGVLGFITRSSLAKFKRKGPTQLTVLYLLSAVANVLYLVNIDTLDIQGNDVSSLVVGILMNLILVAANSVYFRKRTALFCY